MQRGIQYPGSIPLDTDILGAQQEAMIAMGAALQTMLGTSPVATGLACLPTGPASMVINIGPGSITAQSEVDPTAYGSLGTNTNALVKMGINLAATPFTLTAPATSGQSINYLIEGTFQETDGTAIVLPYYNASNPSMPYAGPGNAGTAQNTVRSQIVGLQLLAGASATTGTQTTPGATSGWSPLYVITVNYGQTTVTSGSISVANAAPFRPTTLPAVYQNLPHNSQTFASSGTFTVSANVYVIKVRVWAGGGSGGSSTGAGAAGGGGGGGYTEGAFAVTPGATYTVTVGAGGAIVSGSANGNNGGTSSFVGAGINAVASGGGAGGGSAGGASVGGSAGSSSGATLLIGGTPGGNAFEITSIIWIGGAGGGTFCVGSGQTTINTGGAGGNFPGGGSNGGAYGNPPGAGANGLVIVEF
jgi:hypothetical protein